MNSNNLFQFLQQGFRMTVGATAILIETLQDPQKRESALSQLQAEFSQRSREWAEKGEITEQEARKMVDEILQQRSNWTPGETSSSTTSAVNTTNDPTVVSSQLQELTEEIVSLKKELEQSRSN